MGLDTIPDRSDDTKIVADAFNLLKRVLSGVFVPRDASGGPVASAGSLGQSALSWTSHVVGTIFFKSGSFYAKIQAPVSIAASYIMTFIPSLPSGKTNLRIGSDGAMAVTPPSYSQSNSCGLFTTSSTSDVSVVNPSTSDTLQVTLACTGNPIWIGLVSDGGSSQARVGMTGDHSWLTLYRDGVAVASIEYGYTPSFPSPGLAIYMPPNFEFVDDGAIAGSHVYEIKMRGETATARSLEYVKLMAFEMLG